MVGVAHSINFNLSEKLLDPEYRQKFFLAESSAQIAAQLIALRKRRDLNQHQLAELIGTQQPAISRIEKADYQSWSFSILRKIADALDARLRVLIEPSEDILLQYSEDNKAESATTSGLTAPKNIFLRSPPVPGPGRETPVKRSGLLFREDHTSAAHHRSETREQIESPKLKFKVEPSIELQRLCPGLTNNRPWFAS